MSIFKRYIVPKKYPEGGVNNEQSAALFYWADKHIDRLPLRGIRNGMLDVDAAYAFYAQWIKSFSDIRSAEPVHKLSVTQCESLTLNKSSFVTVLGSFFRMKGWQVSALPVSGKAWIIGACIPFFVCKY